MQAEPPVDPERIAPTDHRRGALGSILIAVAWVALALWRPSVTYHLAPFLVAGAWPFLLRNGPLRVADVDAARGAIAGFVVTIAAALLLVATDAMRGPTLWDGRPCDARGRADRARRSGHRLSASPAAASPPTDGSVM